MFVHILRPSQNGSYFADNIFKLIFFNENWCILIQILQKFIPWNSTVSKPAVD